MQTGMPQRTIADVERLLTAAAGTPVVVRGSASLSPAGSIWRCTLNGGDPVLPRQVVVKARRTDPNDPRSSRDGIGRERAALAYLERLSVDFTPRVLGADDTGEVLVIEDRGPAPSLTDLLLGDDAEAAAAGMSAFAQTLGRLHACTLDGSARYAEMYPARRENTHCEPLSIVHVDIQACWRTLPALARNLGMRPLPDDAVQSEVAAVFHALREPGEWLAFSAGDPCPGNVLIDSERTTLIDFEMAAFRHALIDAAALRFPFPHRTPWARIPAEVIRHAEQAYRSERQEQVPAAGDDRAYESALVPAMAAWAILRLARLQRIDVDDSEALRRRTQIVHTVEAFLETAAAARRLGRLAAWMEALLDVMRGRWPEANQPAPLYTAFGAP